VDVGGAVTIQIATVGTVRHEASGVHELSEAIDGREPAHRRELQDPRPVGERHLVFHRDERVDLAEECGLEQLLEGLGSLHLETLELYSLARAALSVSLTINGE
jgi:hypothetical protein